MVQNVSRTGGRSKSIKKIKDEFGVSPNQQIAEAGENEENEMSDDNDDQDQELQPADTLCPVPSFLN